MFSYTICNVSKVWGKTRKIDRNLRKKLRKWSSCPPGTVRLATALTIMPLRGVDSSSTWGTIWWRVSANCALARTWGSLRGDVPPPRNWKFLYFCNWNHAIGEYFSAQIYTRRWVKKKKKKKPSLGLTDQNFARIIKNQPFVEQNLLILTEYL